MIPTTFVAWLQELGRSLRPWVTVKPWEQAVRVRAGKHVRLLHKGMYLKIPILDTATVFPIRRRAAQACLQTLKSKDGQCVTIGTVVFYRIADLLLVLDTLHSPDSTITAMVHGAISKYIETVDAADIQLAAMFDSISAAVNPAALGIDQFDVQITDNAVLTRRTFRLIQDSRWSDNATIDSHGVSA